ncbi:MAG: hypothetical protein LC135_00035 [Phycisphaerae bacterium]|nr:hypothetical protein [Phycisphaerae bacterium]MCZ2398241.1 hypothetical protein [Phycisphaerae bacterium]
MVALKLMLTIVSNVRAAQDMPDPTTIVADKRLAAINRLFESRDGAETDRHYQRAAERYRATHDKEAFGVGLGGAGAEADWEAGGWLDNNDSVLCVRFDWPRERIAIVDRWLKVNADALTALRQASQGQRWHRAYESKTGRLADVDPTAGVVAFRRLARLRALAAARLAVDGRWDEAALESARNLHTAGHLRAAPLLMMQVTAGSIQDLTVEQLIALLPHLSADGLKQVQAACRAAEALPAASGAQRTWAERLYMLDLIEQYHEWARDALRHPHLAEQIESFLALHRTAKGSGLEQAGLKFEPSSFESPDAFRAAVLKTTPEASWRAFMEQEAAYDAWAAEPLHRALPKRAALGERLRQLAGQDPVCRLLGDLDPFSAGHFRVLRATREARRSALDVLIGLHQFRVQHGDWPEKLDALTPGLLISLPKDPFTGRGLRYVRSDAGFVLYSLGEDQADGGGVRGEGAEGDLVFWPPAVPEYR